MFNGETGKFYIIGTVDGGNVRAIPHEVGHALYYTNSEYHEAVERILNQVDTKPVEEFIFKVGAGFHQDVLSDEAHAFLMTEIEGLKAHGFDVTPYRIVTEQLQANFKKFAGSL